MSDYAKRKKLKHFHLERKARQGDTIHYADEGMNATSCGVPLVPHKREIEHSRYGQ